MANLSEQESWIDGIYQLETSDPVVAGPGGISNRQAEQLASRTAYLKKMQETTGESLQTHLAASDPHSQYAPKNSPALTGMPTAPTTAQTANNTQIATTAFVKSAIAALINGSPAALDTLQELANALGNDPHFSTTILNAIADVKTDASNKLNAHASIVDAHPQYAPKASPAFTGTPTAPTAASGSNDTQLATTAFVKAAVAALVNGSPAALDTLQELANALGNDPNFSTTVLNALAGKLAKDQNGADIPNKAEFRQNIGLSNAMIRGEFGVGGQGAIIPAGVNVLDFFKTAPGGDYSAHLGRNTGIPVGDTSYAFHWIPTLNSQFGSLKAVGLNSGLTYQTSIHSGNWAEWKRQWSSDDFQLPLAKAFGGCGTALGAVRNAEPSSISVSQLPKRWSENQELGSLETSEDGKWLAYISVRHRGGQEATDANRYGFVIFDADMAMPSDEFYIQKQYAGGWRNPIRLFHSGNLTPATIGAMPMSELAGIPLPFPSAVAPAGWLKCNGQQFDTAQFPVLTSRYPSGFLPDLRGEFVRGWDDGRGADAGRALISSQNDAIRSHKHSITMSHEAGGTKDSAGFPATDGSAPFIVHSEANPDGSVSETNGAGNPLHSFGGSETRPRNIAFNYIVRAA
ncbi:tail fiber protein [Pectobacterium brasiliense]|uniref:tail fiber protein n=1 Tax=Pectobacterium brasiliense TaxID=180957 RepID=UPI0015DD89DF|nr:tail fiber protein [Pectobacterium brasiliense]MBA0212902.1 tail fiber protein [Pectobacterium brasiliense]